MFSRIKMTVIAAMVAGFFGVTMAGCGGDDAANTKDAPKVEKGRTGDELKGEGGPVAAPPAN